MSEEIVVLSVFDGMSCGQIALNRTSIKIDKYFASEIDKHAIKVTQDNHPDTIQLGDVTTVKASDLPKIDLLIGGSPCQGFSFAGKQLNFDDPRSALFFEFVRIWNEIKAINPDAKFLLENVNMKKEYQYVINTYLEVFPVRIDSNLSSAQNRDRLYWTNIRTRKEGLFGEVHSDIPQPEDKKIFLKDILQLESEVDEKYYIKNPKFRFEGMDVNGKNNTLRTGKKKSQSKKHNYDIIPVVNDKGNLREVELASCIDANYYKGIDNHAQRTAVYIPEATKKGYAEINPGECVDLEQVKSNTRRGRKMDTKSNSLMSQGNHFHKLTEDYKLRRLTPIECERLQTVEDNYTKSVSDTQRYRMLGNGFTVDVIAHILSFL